MYTFETVVQTTVNLLNHTFTQLTPSSLSPRSHNLIRLPAEDHATPWHSAQLPIDKVIEKGHDIEKPKLVLFFKMLINFQ